VVFPHYLGGFIESITSDPGLFSKLLWSGSYTRKRARVRWHDVCAPKSVGGLSLIDAEEAMYALLATWIIKALGPGESNLQVALRHRLARLQPDRR
jgi:hypothetical protein